MISQEQSRPIRALLLAAGLGTRLRPFTNHFPKCLAVIGDKPLLGHWLDKLAQCGCESVIINTHYLGHLVEQYIADENRKDINIILSHEENLLGTAGTLNKHLDFFKGSTGLLVHADNAMEDNLDGLLRAHSNRPNGCLATMLTFTTNSPSSCGIVEIDTEGKMKNFYEKVKTPPGNLANGAVYVFDQTFIEYVRALGASKKDISRDIIQNMGNRLFTYKTGGRFIDIGSPETFTEAHNFWSSMINSSSSN